MGAAAALDPAIGEATGKVEAGVKTDCAELGAEASAASDGEGVRAECVPLAERRGAKGQDARKPKRAATVGAAVSADGVDPEALDDEDGAGTWSNIVSPAAAMVWRGAAIGTLDDEAEGAEEGAGEESASEVLELPSRSLFRCE